MMSRTLFPAALLALAAFSVTLPAVSQPGEDPPRYVVLMNVDGVDGEEQYGDINPRAAIKLKPDSIARVTESGNIEIECVKVGFPARCSNIGSGSSGDGTAPPAPGITFNGPISSQNNPIPANNTTARLHWSTSNNPRFCMAVSSSPTVSTWTGIQPVSNNANNGFLVGNLTRNQPGGANKTYTFTLGCYSTQTPNLGGTTIVSYSEESHAVVLAPSESSPPTGDGYCAEYKTTNPGVTGQPGFQGHGLTQVERSYHSIWGVTFENMLSTGNRGHAQVNLPAGIATQGKYLSVPLDVPSDNPHGRGLDISWVEPQLTSSEAPTWMELNFSPCPGDFRDQTFRPPSNDPWVGPACRWVDSGKATIAAVTGGVSGCPLPPGKRIWLNMTVHKLNAYRSTGAAPVFACPSGHSSCAWSHQWMRFGND